MSRRLPAQATPNQVTVATASSTAIVSANPTRRRLLIHNVDATNPVFVNDGTATTSHFRIAAGESAEFFTTAALEGIATGADVVVHTWEEFD